jgi:hypothetical protein
MAEESIPNPRVYKLLTTPEGDHLGELYLIQGDLDAAYETLSLYFAEYAFDERMAGGAHRVVSASLFRDGIVLFCACFSAKDADKLNPEETFGHLEGWKEYSQKLLDIRDSFIAHNFGPQRQHNVVLIGLDINGEVVPAGFVQHKFRFAGWIADEGKKLLPFIDVARDHLKRRIENAEQAVGAQIEAMSAGEIAALPDYVLSVPTELEFRMARAKFRRSEGGERLPILPSSAGQRLAGELEAHHSNQQHLGPDEEFPPQEPEPTR